MTTRSTVTRDGLGVVTYTVDDAQTRNALSTQVLADIDRTLTELSTDPGVRVLVFTGAGSTFSSGADRAELGDPATIERSTDLLTSILTQLEAFPAPVVARVNGAAFGAGLAIAASADISITTSDAVFGLPEVRFALVAGPAAAACMARIGKGAALDLLLTGRRFDAAEAHRIQLFNRVVDRDQLDAAVAATVEELLLGDATAITLTRRMVQQLTRPAIAERLATARAAGREQYERSGGLLSRRVISGSVRDVDWRDVPARPRRPRPSAEPPPGLRGDFGSGASDSATLAGSVVTVGQFDGVHLGHAELIRQVVTAARRRGRPSLLLIPEPRPVDLAQPIDGPTVLTSAARRAELARALGIDHVRLVPFELSPAHLGPLEFVEQVLLERLGVPEVVAGANFRFGHRSTDPDVDLAALAERFGFTATLVELVRSEAGVVRSTFVRACVDAGDVARAGLALGRPHRVDGVIEHGDHRGRMLGFPTANLAYDRRASLPADGVYAGRAVFLDDWGQTEAGAPLGPAAISVGTNPTFDGRQRRVEAHILDWNQDLYGRRVGLEFTRQLRSMVKFDGIEELIAQMALDVDQARAADPS